MLLAAGRREDAGKATVRAEVPVGTVPGCLRTCLYRIPRLHLSSVQLQVRNKNQPPLPVLTLKALVELRHSLEQMQKHGKLFRRCLGTARSTLVGKGYLIGYFTLPIGVKQLSPYKSKPSKQQKRNSIFN